MASIAYGEAAPVVDGNVVRVFARLRALEARGAPAAADLMATCSSAFPADLAGRSTPDPHRPMCSLFLRLSFLCVALALGGCAGFTF